MSSLTWFQLLDAADGSPFKGTSTSSVSLPPGNVVGQFRDAVKAKNSNKLLVIDASDLVVYRNKASFDQRHAGRDQGEGPLKSSFPMAGLGTTEEEALAVVVPPPFLPNKSAQQVESTAMDVDSPAMTADEALRPIHAKIAELIEAQNILISSNKSNSGDGQTNLKALGSMESLTDPLIDLDIYRHRDEGGKPELLFSEKILKDEVELGIAMPIEKLKLDRLTVLIGVSGCGKTRTCYDLCRRRWGLYIDCTKDDDFYAMINMLQINCPRIKTKASQERFEMESARLLQCLLTSRLIVLQILHQKCGPTNQLEPFDWFCHQRSRRIQEIFSCVFTLVTKLSRPIGHELYFKLVKADFRSGENGIFIFDESQHLLELLKIDYRSPKSHKRGITSDGKLEFQRSFFSFLTGFLMENGLQSILCGTQMRIRNLEVLYSAAGKKQGEITVFTDFTYLTPDNILALLKKWLIGFDSAENATLFEEIANSLQGRPRFLISYIHSLIEPSDGPISVAKMALVLKGYVNDMTTKNSESGSNYSLYDFWKEKFKDVLEDLVPTPNSEVYSKDVSTLLIKLCVEFLLGDRHMISFSPEEVDMVATGLVMVDRRDNTWIARMAEPLALGAGINFLADQQNGALINYFANILFRPPGPLSLSTQERGHMMELVIALRFMQGWWNEDTFKRFLPSWFDPLSVPKPDLLLDCQRKDSEGKAFLGQLGDGHMSYLLLPHTNAGPDLRYSVFSCCVKTTWTANSRTNMYVSAAECDKNFETMKPENWYSCRQSVEEECEKPSQQSIKKKCGKLIQGRKFIHLLFELPDSAPSKRNRVLSLAGRDDSIIVVNLHSEFALHFFGKAFVNKYIEFVEGVIDQAGFFGQNLL